MVVRTRLQPAEEAAVHAAVVTSFDAPPSYQEFKVPTPRGADEVLVGVVASGLHRRVRSQADGSHYTSTGELPLIPGVDGVARLPDGSLRYFALGDTTFGAMAEQTVIDLRRSFELPAGIDPVQVAAAMNPAMSSWVGLKRRADFGAGQSVLVLGATGSSGQMAVQVAKLLGAGRVIAAGRDPRRLAACKDLGADEVVRLGESPGLGEVAAEVDVVIDYLWGQVTAEAMTEIATHRRDGARPLTWVEIGAVAGATAVIPAAALRALPLQIVGSGQGSVSTRDILSELPAIADAVGSGALRIDARAVPLSDVATVWQDADEAARIVLTP
jgi:NADPH:quinone reductase-like Zn-dependent oxidoreductase